MTDQALASPSKVFIECYEALRLSIDAELHARMAEWFPSLPPEDLATLQGLLAGGKRLRACLACLVAQALGGRTEQALPAAVALEVVQGASLVHDDFIDGDALRRGRPAAWTLLSARRAVLLADVMFATAIEKMSHAGAREGATLARAIATMALGAFSEATPAETRSAYRRIIFLKTGSLFAAAAQLGALATHASDAQALAAHEFGSRVGEAYQIADDLADLRRGDMRTLEPALHHFLGDGEAMEQEIARSVRSAREQLACFPPSEATDLLVQLPGVFARVAG